MSAPGAPLPGLPAPIGPAVRHALLSRADELAGRGEAAAASSLRELVERWWGEQQRWKRAAVGVREIHHEINNALIAVSGNVQLALMGADGAPPEVRRKLENALHEARRLGIAAQRLHEFGSTIGHHEPDAGHSGAFPHAV